MILSETTIAYHGRATGTLKAVTNKFSSIKAWGRIDADGSRYLVSDSQGVLGLIVLLRDGNNVTDIKLEVLGEVGKSLCFFHLFSSNPLDNHCIDY